MGESAMNQNQLQNSDGYKPEAVPNALKVIHGNAGNGEQESSYQEPSSSHDQTLLKNPRVPKLLMDGGSIDISYDNHENAAKWFQAYMGLNIEQVEDWTPDPRVLQGKMTHLGWGLWLDSYLSEESLPYHFADRGAIAPQVRWCWKIRDLMQAHAFLMKNGVRVTEIYRGPEGYDYFDFWATDEEIRLTAQGDPSMEADGFADSGCIRVGVRNLLEAVKWYTYYLGLDVISMNNDERYAVLRMGMNYDPDGSYTYILEEIATDNFTGKIDGAVRVRHYVESREQFFEYHKFLKAEGIEPGDFGGYTVQGVAYFHFYDPDGNRINVSNLYFD